MDQEFYGEARPTGSHSQSLKRLLEGEGDFTVLDSTVFDFLPQDVASELKIVESFGPFPSPLVVGRSPEFARACSRLTSLPHPFYRLEEIPDTAYDSVRRAWNLSLSGRSGPQEQVFVTGQGVPKLDFTSREQQLTDQKILTDVGKELLTRLNLPPTEKLAGGPELHRLRHGEREHHHYLISPGELAQGNLSIVGFMSRMKPTADIQVLFDVDAELLDQLSLCQGFLTYSPTEYTPKLWANLAVFRSSEARDYWAANSTHLKAIKDLGPTSYDNVRLHLGIWPSIDEPMEWVATRYLKYDEEGLWRGVRTTPPLGGRLPTGS
jgi:hypothetical protein